MLQIIQQRHKCIGCNYCVEAAPDRWRMSKADGKCSLVDATNNKGFWRVHVGEHERAANEVAASVCPISIIQIR